MKKNNKQEVIGFCKKHGITQEQFYGKEKIDGHLYLRSLTSIPDGFNPTVGGSLDLNSLTSIPDGFNPTVGGYLDLNSLTSIPDGFNPTVGGYIYLRSLTSIPDSFNPTVGGSLYLRSLTSIPDSFNPTVGGSFDLRSLTSIPDGFNPTVGGSLYLSSLTSIPDGFNPTVGGYLDLGSKSECIGSQMGNLFWTKENGDTYAMFDNMFCQIVSQKTKDEYTIYETRKIGSKESVWVVSDGKTNAHSDKGIKEAFEELKFKIASEKLKKEPISLDTIITVDRYRIVTGACEYGCRQFMDKHNIKYEIENDRAVVKQEVTAKQLLEILEKDNAYGLNSFKKLITQ